MGSARVEWLGGEVGNSEVFLGEGLGMIMGLI